MNFLVDDFKGWKRLDYAWLISACTAITLITLSMGGSYISIIRAIANVVCVILVAKGKISNYAWGLVGVVAYAYLAYTWGYFGETFLNIGYYLPMQFVGFYLWNKNKSNTNDSTVSSSVVVESLTPLAKLGLALIVPLCIFLLTLILNELGGKLTLLDASTTVLSVVAMLLMTLRLKEQWYMWIIVNIISIYMWYVSYTSGNVDGIATLLMWGVFLINACYGLYEWNKKDNTFRN